MPKGTLLEPDEPRSPLLWATGFSNWIFLKSLGMGYDDGPDVYPTRIPHSVGTHFGATAMYTLNNPFQRYSPAPGGGG